MFAKFRQKFHIDKKNINDIISVSLDMGWVE